MSHVSGRLNVLLQNARLELSQAERLVSSADQRMLNELQNARRHLEAATLLLKSRLDPQSKNTEDWDANKLSMLLTDEV